MPKYLSEEDNLLELIITLAIIGLIVWAITTYLPMPDLFKKAIYVVAAICVIIFVLNAFGIWHGGRDIPVPQLRK